MDEKIILFPTERIVNKETARPDPRAGERVRVDRTKEFVEGNVDEIAMNMLRQFVEMAMKKIGQISDAMRDKITTDEPRLVLPFFDENLQLTGLTCRALGNESLRYVTVRIKPDELLVFGRESLNPKKHIYVTEGPIDSLFLPNSIAVSGTGFNKLEQLNYSKDIMTIIVDNQPGNKEVCRVIENLIDQDLLS